MTDISVPPHLGDSELLHLVDGDATAFELDHWTKHVLDCSHCARRLEVLQRRTGALTRLLAEVQLPQGFTYPELPSPASRPRRSRSRPVGGGSTWLRAAAVVLAVAAPLVLVQPLRAWVADQLSEGWARVASLVRPGNPDSPGNVSEASSTVWFGTSRPGFTVEITSAQADGELILMLAGAGEGSLTVVGGADENPVLVDGGLRIQNSARSTASYELALPASVTQVRVLLRGAVVTVLSAEDVRNGARVDLGSGGR